MYIYPMSWRSISSYPLSIVQHTHRDSRGPSVSGCFFINCLFFNSYYGFMSEPKILFDDKAVYIHKVCIHMYVHIHRGVSVL